MSKATGMNHKLEDDPDDPRYTTERLTEDDDSIGAVKGEVVGVFRKYPEAVA